MATPDEVRRRLREVEAGLQPYGPPGGTAVPTFGATARGQAGRPPSGSPGGPAPAGQVAPGWTWVDGNTYQDPFGWLHDWDPTNLTWDPWGEGRMEAVGLLGGGAAAAGRDPVLARLTEEQILSEQQARELAAAEEARAAEMQPYDIASIQSSIEARKAQQEYNERELERELLSDRFGRARDAFNAAQLAEQLAEEKKRTATSLLTSIVDNLVPPGMTELPGLPGSTMPTVATVDWTQMGGGLDPQTDQALQYLLSMQQQSAGV